jgi:hypothetical protein
MACSDWTAPSLAKALRRAVVRQVRKVGVTGLPKERKMQAAQTRKDDDLAELGRLYGAVVRRVLAQQKILKKPGIRGRRIPERKGW